MIHNKDYDIKIKELNYLQTKQVKLIKNIEEMKAHFREIESSGEEIPQEMYE